MSRPDSESSRNKEWMRLFTKWKIFEESGSSTGSYASVHPTDRKSSKKLPLVNERGQLNVELKGYPRAGLYWGDLFHTLVNLPSLRFTVVLLLTYSVLFLSFGVGFYYDAYKNNCIPGVNHFSHAIWFSVQTSMTIGYGGELTPDPNCLLTNVLVTLQSVASLLVAYSLLGVVYARFSRPTRRASTIVFSRYMVLHEENGIARLAFRVANVRKHQVIEARVRMLVALNNVWIPENESNFKFTNLSILGGSQVFLGLPCIVAHPLSQTSPIFGLSYEMMERSNMEILVLLEGVDASTSAKLQARHSYKPCDIRYNHRFATMVTRQESGRRRVDFTLFQTVVPIANPWLISPRTGNQHDQIKIPSHENTSPLSSGKKPQTLPPILQSPRALSLQFSSQFRSVVPTLQSNQIPPSSVVLDMENSSSIGIQTGSDGSSSAKRRNSRSSHSALKGLKGRGEARDAKTKMYHVGQKRHPENDKEEVRRSETAPLNTRSQGMKSSASMGNLAMAYGAGEKTSFLGSDTESTSRRKSRLGSSAKHSSGLQKQNRKLTRRDSIHGSHIDLTSLEADEMIGSVGEVASVLETIESNFSEQAYIANEQLEFWRNTAVDLATRALVAKNLSRSDVNVQLLLSFARQILEEYHACDDRLE